MNIRDLMFWKKVESVENVYSDDQEFQCAGISLQEEEYAAGLDKIDRAKKMWYLLNAREKIAEYEEKVKIYKRRVMQLEYELFAAGERPTNAEIEANI